MSAQPFQKDYDVEGRGIPVSVLDAIHPGRCEDLFKLIPDASVDLVVSSPPYNIGKEYENKKGLNHYLDEQREILRECARVLSPSGSLFWQVGSYPTEKSIIPLDIRLFPILEDLDMIPKNRIVWVRQHGLHASRKFSGRHETLLWFSKSTDCKFDIDPIRVPQKYQNKKSYRGDSKGQLSCNPDGKNPGDVWAFRNVKHNHEEQTIHPCQFPEDMIARIILASTTPGDVVLDPYMGTGTVAVVAAEHGRHFTGAELDARYHAVALRRLAGTPDAENCFPNLKTLRRYVTRTGQPIGRFRFDLQIGNNATAGEVAKIYDEPYHLDELEARLNYEEDVFAARLSGEEPPANRNYMPKEEDRQLSINLCGD